MACSVSPPPPIISLPCLFFVGSFFSFVEFAKVIVGKFVRPYWVLPGFHDGNRPRRCCYLIVSQCWNTAVQSREYSQFLCWWLPIRRDTWNGTNRNPVNWQRNWYRRNWPRNTPFTEQNSTIVKPEPFQWLDYNRPNPVKLGKISTRRPNRTRKWSENEKIEPTRPSSTR